VGTFAGYQASGMNFWVDIISPPSLILTEDFISQSPERDHRDTVSFSLTEQDNNAAVRIKNKR